MDFAYLGIAVAIVVMVVATLMASIAVGPGQRLVIFRFGRSDPTQVRGPGRSFLVPIRDRGVLVEMGERQLDLASLPGTTSDGRDIEADVHIHCRVVDPYEFVTNVAFFEEAVESLTSKLVRETAPQLMLDAATQTRSIEQALEMSLTTTLGRWGVECLEVRVEAGLATSRRADPAG